MKSFNLLLLVFVLFLCNSCDIFEKDTTQEPKLSLSAIGFTGSLPNGITVSQDNLITSNSLEAFSSSNEGSYVTHILNLADPACVSISIELPPVKFSNDFIKVNDSIMSDAAKNHYTFSQIKEKLTIGTKEIVSQQSNGIAQGFRVGVFNQKTYEGYVAEQGLDQSGSYLKVIDTEEGTETDPQSGNVKTLEVTFDLNVKLYSYYPELKYTGRIKGLLRVKYKEKI